MIAEDTAIGYTHKDTATGYRLQATGYRLHS